MREDRGVSRRGGPALTASPAKPGAQLRRGAALAACLLAAALAPLPGAAAEDTWDADVEAAERYRVEERERAERYRAQVEAKAEAAAAPERAEAEPAPREGAPERFAARLQAWLADLVADLLNAVAEALRRTLAEWFGVDPPAPERRGDGLAPGASDDLDGWLRREQERAREWLAGERAEPGAAPP